MAVIKVRDPSSGQIKKFNIKGDTPTDTEKQRILNVPDNKDTVRICNECVRELNPEIRRKKESGDFD